MDKTVRVYCSFDEMKADEYRYWQSRPVHERMDAVSKMTLAAYAMEGAAPDVPRFQRTVVILQTGITADDLADPRKFFRFGKEPIAIDVLPGIDGVDFDAAWEKRVEGVVDPQSGLTCFSISKEDLIASKLAAGRLRDLADAEEIRGSAESQLPETKPGGQGP